MSKQQHSASLQIFQVNQRHIQISGDSFQIEINNDNNFMQNENQNDIFQLSLDENSLTFNIQQNEQNKSGKSILKEGTVNLQINQTKNVFAEKIQKKQIPLIQQERKRKRKEIFQKYKQKSTQNLLSGVNLESNKSNLMDTIDEILKIKSPEKTEKTQNKNSCYSENQIQNSSNHINNPFKKKISSPKLVITSFEQLPKCQQNLIKNINKQPLVSTQQKKQLQQSQFKLPSNIGQIKMIDEELNIVVGSTNSFLLQSDVNKISLIETQNLQTEVSRDSYDIQDILKSQIFKDNGINQTIKKSDLTYNKISFTMMNPSQILSSQKKEDFSKNQNILNGQMLKKDKSQTNLNANDNANILKRNLSQRNLNIFQLVSLKQRLIVKNQPKSHIQNRIPTYLSQIRRRNAIYPNFYINIKNRNIFVEQNIIFKQLLTQFKNVLTFLDVINEIVYQRYTHLKNKENQLVNQFKVETFASIGWQKIFQIKDLDRLKPHENFIKRKYEYQKVKGALNNYLQITQYYQKSNLNLEEQKYRKKYFEIRSKFWQIEKNIKMIGEDIYSLAIEEVFPFHYYDFLKIIKGQYFKSQRENLARKLQYFRYLLGLYYLLKSNGDILCNSQIGACVKQKLQKLIQMSFLI